MAVCPKCGKEIESLDCVIKEKSLQSYCENDCFTYVEQIEHEVEYWKCPLCYERLDIEPDSDAADIFLR